VSGELRRILTPRSLPLPSLVSLLSLLALLAATPGCKRGPDAEARRQTASLAEALRPAYFAEAVRRAGGAHYHGTARFAAGLQAPDDAVTTTTDVWMDKARNYRLAELNDRDGGREVVLVGRELYVALRYGKMIRRVAEEPEPTRLVEEALGAPWAAWEVVQPYAAIQRAGGQNVAGRPATEYKLTRATARTDDPAAQAPATGLRAWRAGIVVNELAGRALVDDATGALLQLDVAAKFMTKREGRELAGTVDVHGALSDVGAAAEIARPVFEDLALRQRIVPEERELLGGLPRTRPLPQPAPKLRAGGSAAAFPGKPSSPASAAPAAPPAQKLPRKGWTE
jgi:hypothetical protein